MADRGGQSMKRFGGTGSSPNADYAKWRRWLRAFYIVQRSKGTPSTALGPLTFTLLDDVAERAVRHIDITDLEVDGGEEILLDVLDERYPEPESQDRIGEALNDIETLRRGPKESMQEFGGRARGIFANGEKEGIVFASTIRGFKILNAANLGRLEKSTVLSHSRGWEEMDIVKGIRLTFPEKDHGRVAAGVVEDAFHVENVVNNVNEPDTDDIEALVSEYNGKDNEVIDEQEAIEALSTWLGTRQASNQEKLSRGFSSPSSNPGPKPDLAVIAKKRSGATTARRLDISREIVPNPLREKAKAATVRARARAFESETRLFR
jgi:hypothetical protein